MQTQFTSCILRCLFCLAFLKAIPAKLSQAQEEDWDVAPIYVPVEEQQTYIPPDFWFIESAELNQKLERLKQQRIQDQLNPAVLRRAVYLATLTRDLLYSDCSSWQFGGSSQINSMILGKTSLALRDAKLSPVDFPTLSSVQRFDPKGNMEIVDFSRDQSYWFGFQRAAEVADDMRRFDLQIPMAQQAVMLIQADSSLMLNSLGTVVEQIATPNPWLTENWPKDQMPRSQPRQSWWLVYLSGIENFSIQVNDANVDRGISFRHLVKNADFTAVVDQTDIQTNYQLAIDLIDPAQPLKFRLQQHERLKSVTQDGVSLKWKIVDSTSNIISIDLNRPKTASTTTIQVQTIHPIETSLSSSTETKSKSQSIQVNFDPMELLDAYYISGTTSVTSIEPLTIESLSSSTPFRRSESQDPIGATPNRWIGKWNRKPTQALLQLALKKEQFNTDTLVQLSIQASSIQARANIALSGRNLSSNELRIPVLKGWTIEQARVIRPELPALAISQRSNDDTEEIVLRWQGQSLPADLQLELVLNHHYVQDLKSIEVANTQLLEMPTGASVVSYAISPSADYKLRWSPRLLPMKVEWKELSLWQQNLVAPDEQIFRDLSGESLYLVFDRSTSRKSARQVTLIQRDESPQQLLKTAFDFASGLSQEEFVVLQFPEGEDASQWSYQVVVDSIYITPGNSASLVATPLGSQSCKLRFPILPKDQFTLICTRPLPTKSNNTFTLPVLSLKDVDITDSHLLIPSNWSCTQDPNVIEICPDLNWLAKSQRKFIESLLTKMASAEQFASWSPIKLLVSAPFSLSVSKSRDTTDTNWIWRKTLTHSINANGICRHHIQLDLQATTDAPLEIEFPKSWRLVDATMNDQPVAAQFKNDNQTAVFSLQSVKRSRFDLAFESSANPLGWLSKVRLASPTIQLPTLQSTVVVSTPSEYFAGRFIRFSAESQLYQLSSLLPRNWWSSIINSLSLSENSIEISGLPPTDTASSDTPPHELYILHKNSILAFAVVFILLSAIVSFWLVKKTPGIWWAIMISLYGFCVLQSSIVVLCAQLLFIGFSLGAAARLIERSAKVSLGTRKAISPSVTRLSISLLFISYSAAQSLAQSNSPLDSREQGKKRLYAVIIPFDEETNQPSDFAYIPKELRDKLPGFGPTAAKLGSTSIVSASHILKLKGATNGLQNTAEFLSEFRIQCSDSGDPLLLPYDLNVLKLSTITLNGQNRLLGVRNFDVASDQSGIIFRPDSPGIATVGLQFQINLEADQQRKYTFNTRIPCVPSSVLKLFPTANTVSLQSNASGGMQKTLTGEYNIFLGGNSDLTLEWREQDRVLASSSADYTSETWVHADADTITVAARITLDRGISNQLEFDFVVDADWEPVGTRFGVAKLVSTNLIPALKRRVLRLKIDQASEQSCVVQMLLAQRSPLKLPSLDIPFVSVDRLSNRSKVLWWSGSKTNWVLEGVETAQPRLPRDSWQELQLASDRIGYQVAGTLVKVRQQQASQVVGSTSETSVLRVFQSHSELELDSVVDKLAGGAEEIEVVLPEQSQLKIVEINGRAVMPSSARGNRLKLPSTLFGSNENSLRVIVQMRPLIGDVRVLPRIRIESLFPRQASYQIYRGSGLEVEFQPSDTALEFSSTAPVINRRRLETLESYVGQAVLPPELLNDKYLPAPIKVLKISDSPHHAFTIQLERDNEDWRAKVLCVWNSQQSASDYAAFEIPSNLRDLIDTGQSGCVFRPFGVKDRLVMCMPITKTATSTTQSVEFEFPLQTTSNQNVVIPSIVALNGHPSYPVLLLPDFVVDPVGESKRAEWNLPIEPIQENLAQQLAFNSAASFKKYQLTGSDLTLTWSTDSTSNRQTRIEFVWLDVTTGTSRELAGVVHYWIVPRQQTFQTFKIPSGCKVLGVDCGTYPANWSVLEDQLQVTLSPNTMPLALRVMVNWQAQDSTALILPPIPQHSETSNELYLSVQDSIDWQPTTASGQSDLATKNDALRSWVKILVDIRNQLDSRRQNEIPQWLSPWNPDNFGFDRQSSLPVDSLKKELAQFDLDGNGSCTVGEAWESIQLTLSLEDETTLQQTLSTNGGGLSRLQLKTDGGQFLLRKRETLDASIGKNWLMVTFLFLAVSVGVYLGTRIKPLFQKLATQFPWLIWLSLAILALLILPTTIPAIVLFALTSWIAVLQWMDYRRSSKRYGF